MMMNVPDWRKITGKAQVFSLLQIGHKNFFELFVTIRAFPLILRQTLQSKWQYGKMSKYSTFARFNLPTFARPETTTKMMMVM